LEIQTPHHAPAWFTLPVLVLVVVVKELLSRRVLSAGDAMGSTALKGDAWHHRSDAITSGAAAIGITIALIGGKGFEMADDWAALLACGVITINGVLILKGALHDVLDGKVSGDIHSEIAAYAHSVVGVRAAEKCRVRKSGVGFFVEIHVWVDPAISVYEGHQIGHKVKDQIMASEGRVQDVTVHIEPAASEMKHPFLVAG
jgi:cation diffusion facilitator family transporter